MASLAEKERERNAKRIADIKWIHDQRLKGGKKRRSSIKNIRKNSRRKTYRKKSKLRSKRRH